MSKEVKWKCPKCGDSRFRVILEQIMSEVYNRDEEPKEWEFTDATIETQEAKIVQCMNCGTILKQIPQCPKCGGTLETKKFIDSYDADDQPADVYSDLYCPKCDLRWLWEPGPHDFFKN